MALTANLTLTSDVSIDAGIGKTGATTYFSQINETSLDTANYIGSGSGISTGYSAEFALSDMPACIGIDKVVFTISAGVGVTDNEDTQRTRAFIRHAGTRSNESWVLATSSTTPRTWTLAKNPVTGAPWTQAGVNALQCGIELEYGTIAGSFSTCWMLYATVYYTPAPASITVARDVGSRMLWMKRGPEVRATLSGNLDLMVPGFLGALDVEHEAAPHATDAGWQAESWQRRPMVIYETTIDPNAMTVEVQARDMRPLLCLVRDLAWSDKASGALGDGIARFATPGATWTFTRASSATFTNPVGESETVAKDVPAYADGGLQILAAAGGRAQDIYRVSNNSTARTWPAARGGFSAEVSLASVSAFGVVCAAYHNANNFAEVWWDGSTNRWKFTVKASGSTATAYKDATPSSSTFYRIGARWIGSAGEHGLTAYTIDVFVDGVKGTSATAAGTMTEVASPTYGVEFGAFLTAVPLNGQIRKIHIFQYPPSDIEMSRPL